MRHTAGAIETLPNYGVRDGFAKWTDSPARAPLAVPRLGQTESKCESEKPRAVAAGVFTPWDCP
jgi:hypothetical protein